MQIVSSQPLLSILMPVRNEASYLPRSLKSIVYQTFQHWELIVVDDDSSDETPDILAAAAACDTRIKVVQSNSKGLVNALNTGLSYCSAALIARMDGDDISHTHRFEKQISFLKSNPEIGLVASSFRHFPRTTLKQGMIDYETWQNSLLDHDSIMLDILVESPFVHPSVVFKRSIIDELGGYRDCGWPEDYDLWLRMASAGVKFARHPESLFFWRDHPERATRTMSEYSRDAFRRCKCEHLLNGFLKNEQSVVIAGTGIEGRAWQRLLAAQSIRIDGWIDVDPRKTGRELHGAIIQQPDFYNCFRSKLLIAIGVQGAREQFRGYLHKNGLRDGIDFIAVS